MTIPATTLSPTTFTSTTKSLNARVPFPICPKDFGRMVNLVFKGKAQDLLYDGIHDERRPAGPNPMNICIQQAGDGLRFANIDAANDFENVATDLSVYNCRREALQ